uniref:Protein amnionless n=1 Tax=Elaeophora elaphi TaxID=1147741 RepID=A0A0R3RJW7_9BILA
MTVNNDTFNDSFLRSIEGQLQFDLATKLKSIRSIDGIDYQWPKFTNTVAIMGETATKYSAGQFNSNLEAEKLVLICYYQQCQLMARKCAGTFRPIGHCCEICGSMLRFRTTIFNFDKFQKQIENYERENQIVMEYDLDIASLRIDHNDPMPHYQIVVLARAGTKHPFDEQIYRVVLKDLAGFVQNNFGIPHSMTVTEIEEIISVNFHSSPKDDFVLALTSLFAIGAIVTGIIFAVGRKFNFANFRGLSSQNSLYEAVHWRGAESEDELELLRYDQSTLNTTANEVQFIGILNFIQKFCKTKENKFIINKRKYLTNQVPECSSTFENVAFDGEITDDIKEK